VNAVTNVEVWGSGTPKREFLYSDDLADACIYLMNNFSGSSIVNIGVGEDLSIKELATKVKEIIGYEGEIVFNTNMPDGTPRKLVDIQKISHLGWKATTTLDEGIKRTYEYFLNHTMTVS
jgi:GDP-L-fucose synthase